MLQHNVKRLMLFPQGVLKQKCVLNLPPDLVNATKPEQYEFWGNRSEYNAQQRGRGGVHVQHREGAGYTCNIVKGPGTRETA